MMSSEELRNKQAPLKQKYREDPDAAIVTLRAEGKLDENISCSVKTGRALSKAGLHPATGGDGSLACSGDLLLEALVACAGVTLNAVATAIEVNIRNGKVRAEGDLDFKGTLGVSKNVPVGFSSIRLTFELDCNEEQEKLDTLLKLTKRYCVVYQTIAAATPLESTIESWSRK